jgi:hypothetical protein
MKAYSGAVEASLGTMEAHVGGVESHPELWTPAVELMELILET